MLYLFSYVIRSPNSTFPRFLWISMTTNDRNPDDAEPGLGCLQFHQCGLRPPAFCSLRFALPPPPPTRQAPLVAPCQRFGKKHRLRPWNRVLWGLPAARWLALRAQRRQKHKPPQGRGVTLRVGLSCYASSPANPAGLAPPGFNPSRLRANRHTPPDAPPRCRLETITLTRYHAPCLCPAPAAGPKTRPGYPRRGARLAPASRQAACHGTCFPRIDITRDYTPQPYGWSALSRLPTVVRLRPRNQRYVKSRAPRKCRARPPGAVMKPPRLRGTIPAHRPASRRGAD